MPYRKRLFGEGEVLDTTSNSTFAPAETQSKADQAGQGRETGIGG